MLQRHYTLKDGGVNPASKQEHFPILTSRVIGMIRRLRPDFPSSLVILRIQFVEEL